MDKDTKAELEQLRAQVAELSKARAEQRAAELARAAAATAEASGPSGASADSVVDTLKAAAAVDLDDAEGLSSHLDQLLEQLEHEIRDLPTITTLAVFSLGVLFGRLLR